MSGYFKRYWPMRQGAPNTKGQEIFKCTDCGGETEPDAGFNGEPDPANCFKHCKSKENKKKPFVSKTRFNINHDKMFPDAPGAGM